MMNVSEIFNEEPVSWGLRGDPYLWQEMKVRLQEVPMPPTTDGLQALLERTYEEATGHPISDDAPVFVERFAHGGMSSGSISPKFWVERGIPLLVGRHRRP